VQRAVHMPLFNTSLLHAAKALDFALQPPE